MNFQSDSFFFVMTVMVFFYVTLGGVFVVIYHTVWWVRLAALAVATVGFAALVTLMLGVIHAAG